jgi:hypothetical protein
MGSVVNHQPMSGFNTTIRVAKGAVKPTGSTVTLSALAEQGDETLVVEALTEDIAKGNWLLFTDADGLEYLIKTTADAEAGDLALAVEALVKDIPDESTASFPPELYDRNGVDVDRQTNTVNVISLNTGGTELQVLTTSNASANAGGYWHWWNPGLRICEDQFAEKTPFWVMIEYESPDPDLYSKGEEIYGRAIINTLPKTSPADGFVSMDLTFQFTGQTTTVPPVAIPAPIP